MMNKPPQEAIALFYDGETAPKITAKGSGNIAEEIIAIAVDSNVPLYQNTELVNLLAALELGDEIPELLYFTIAEIIAFAYKIQGKYPAGWQPHQQNEPKDGNHQSNNNLPYLPGD